MAARYGGGGERWARRRRDLRTLMMMMLMRRRWALMMMMVEQRCIDAESCNAQTVAAAGWEGGQDWRAAERTIAGVMTARCVAAMVAAAAASSPP